jgi:two-component system, NarL family, response regulator YdfI
VIRVLLASDSDELENAIRSIPSLEFRGRVDHDFSGGGELSGDVLLCDFGSADDWHALVDVPIPVVLLLDPADAHAATAALRSGIRGAIARDATREEIQAAVEAVNAGLVVTAADFVSATPATVQDLIEPLTDREREVLELVAEGLSNKLIAHQLNISEHTVKTHVASIFAKLGASSRTEAVSQAIRKGLVML